MVSTSIWLLQLDILCYAWPQSSRGMVEMKGLIAIVPTLSFFLMLYSLQESFLLPSWVQGIELRSSDLVASDLTCCAIPPALELQLLMSECWELELGPSSSWHPVALHRMAVSVSKQAGKAAPGASCWSWGYFLVLFLFSCTELWGNNTNSFPVLPLMI